VPDTGWPHISAGLVLEGLNSTTITEDSLLFIRLIGFVVTVQREALELARFNLSGKNSPRVTNIRAEYLIANNQHGDASTATEVYIYPRIVIERFIRGFERLC